jgi:tetratricopeptide (TPR) repeat protein
MLLMTHRYPQPVPALSNALMLYYRSYCRDLLGYTYYAGEDLRVAATLSVKGLSPRFPGGLQVLQLTIQRNPTDASARFLLALLHRSAGRVSAAREALRNALKLRPVFPDAEALLAELGPGPAPARKIRPAGSGPAPDAYGHRGGRNFSTGDCRHGAAHGRVRRHRRSPELLHARQIPE